jgi:hypothetical protein
MFLTYSKIEMKERDVVSKKRRRILKRTFTIFLARGRRSQFNQHFLIVLSKIPGSKCRKVWTKQIFDEKRFW